MRSRHRELEGVLLFHMGGLVARDLTCPALASKNQSSKLTLTLT